MMSFDGNNRVNISLAVSIYPAQRGPKIIDFYSAFSISLPIRTSFSEKGKVATYFLRKVHESWSETICKRTCLTIANENHRAMNAKIRQSRSVGNYKALVCDPLS